MNQLNEMKRLIAVMESSSGPHIVVTYCSNYNGVELDEETEARLGPDKAEDLTDAIAQATLPLCDADGELDSGEFAAHQVIAAEVARILGDVSVSVKFDTYST